MDTSSQFVDGEALVDAESGRPASTAELMKMINEAGTELTVKYITGELDFEQFTAEVERRAKAQRKGKSGPSNSVQGPSTSKASSEPKTNSGEPSKALQTSSSDIPGFDQLMREDSGEEEDDGKDEPVMEEEEEDEFEDAGALEEGSDQDWVPDKEDAKKLKADQKEKKRKGMPAPSSPVKKKRKPRRKIWDIPKHLKGSQGQAMLLKAQGNTEEAIQMLYDIIKKAPKAAAPYQALGTIQEEMGNPHQGLKFLMVAANLRHAEPSDWFELRDMCMKLEEPKLAITCLYRAMKYAKTPEEKLEIIQAKTEFLKEQGMHAKALQSRGAALVYMPRSNAEAILTEARQLIKESMAADDMLPFTISTLQYIHKEFPRDIDAEDIHLLVELMMSQQNYLSSLEILVQHCGVKLTISGQEFEGESAVTSLSEIVAGNLSLDKVEAPTLMPLDLRSKLVQCFVLLKVLLSLDTLQSEIDLLTQEDVEEYGDIHYDLAEAMMDSGYRDNAKAILHVLVSSTKFNKAGVWLTYGHCLNALGEIQPAAEAYGKVVELAPNHYGARVLVASLQQQMGHSEKALEVLSKGNEGENVADQFLLLHKCNLLHAHNRMSEFIPAARKLLFKSSPPDFNYVSALVTSRTLKSRGKYVSMGLKKASTGDGDSAEVKELEKKEQKKFCEDLWQIYLKLYEVLNEQGKEKQLLETAMLGLTCRAFIEDPYKFKEAEFMCLKIGRVNRTVYNLARGMVLQDPENNQSWNLYSSIMSRYKDISDQRFISRALMRDPHNIALCMMNGNVRLISGTYKQALAEYLSVFRQSPDNVLAILGCALSLLHITTQNFVAQRNVLIPQVLCLLNIYREMRGECQETYYNFGRAMYQLNLPFAAMKFYKKALQFPPAVADEEGRFDLSMDIAHNLAHLYIKVGNMAAARHYIRTYCAV